MKIALVSYEYPPDTAIGGIATYVRQAAQMLAQRGHTVEVFAASSTRAGCETESRYRHLKIHRIQLTDRTQFAQAIAPVFAQRHQLLHFDVLEGPDCGADAAVITTEFPDLPLVLKLHTPSYILRRVGHTPLTGLAKARFCLGALRGGNGQQLPRCRYLRSHPRSRIPACSAGAGNCGTVPGDRESSANRLAD
ncbi:MAG: glycosyltransferase family 4 protein [Alkalinema sp. RL_2_19]|nr:glycosyltransferase family 4 protein [Alkalinema sp. RL_2_19]